MKVFSLHCTIIVENGMSNLRGSCMCGAIQFDTTAAPAFSVNCHCQDCRAATGAAYATINFVAADQITVKGTPKKFEHTADSGNILTKHFCSNCGSTLFTSNSARNNMMGIMAGVVSNIEDVKPQLNVFVSSKIPSTPLDNNIPAHEKMPS